MPASRRAAEPADVGGLVAPDSATWTMERRVDLALAIERAARARDALDHNVEDTVYADSEGRAALATSNGFCASFEQTQATPTHTRLPARARDRMTGIGLGVARGPDDIEPEAVGAEAADRALALHGARQPSSRRCPVVLDPHVAASFASVIGRTLSADAVQRGRSLFAGKEGEQIADPAPATARRRPRSGGARDRPVRRRGHATAAHAR